MNFDHYYRGGRFTQTAEFVEFCKPLLPKYIDTILEFGCANGRNLQIFNKEYNLQGYDIVKKSDIEFVMDFSNFKYKKSTIEEWIKVYNKDLSKTFVMCSGTLMYISSDSQNKLIEKLFKLNCKNMAFQEYYPDLHPSQGPPTGGGANFNKKYMDLFEIHNGWRNNNQNNEKLSVLIGIDNYNW